jgi:hypothetical protein
MRRGIGIGGLAVIVLALGLMPVAAQGGFTPDDQAALDDVQAAFEGLLAAETYTADLTQNLTQDIGVSFQGQQLALAQQVESSGTVQFQQAPANTFANRTLSLDQTVTQTLSGAGLDSEQLVIGPMTFEFIVFDDELYMRMDVPLDMQGLVPEGWQVVTEGAEVFPGMGMYNMEQVTQMGGNFDPEYLRALIAGVTAVELLEPETVEGQALNRYQLTLDPVQTLEALGAANLENMFNTGAVPFDVPALIDLIYNDEDTRHTIEVAIGADDGALHSYAESVWLDVEIAAEMLDDPSLAGAEMTLTQTMVQTLTLTGVDVPVEIAAPDLDEADDPPAGAEG